MTLINASKLSPDLVQFIRKSLFSTEWAWQNADKIWHRYPEEVSIQLEHRSQSKRPLQIIINDTHFVIDLDKMQQMLVKQSWPRVPPQRVIRRPIAPFPS